MSGFGSKNRGGVRLDMLVCFFKRCSGSVLLQGVGVPSCDVDGNTSEVGVGAEGICRLRMPLLTESIFALVGLKAGSSMLSSFAFSRSTIDFQLEQVRAAGVWGDESPVDGGVYLRTISVQRSNMPSWICKLQLMALRKVISLVLISWVLRPEILLHARAEKFRSCKYLEAKMRDARNIRRPHCRARKASLSPGCSMVKSHLGTCGLIRMR
jgi:hypothetical protein